MDSTHFDLLLFQRQQLQCNVLDPLQRIKGAIGRSMQPREVDAVKALLNREVRNFVLAEVYDGQHLMEVFDLCYGQDNLKFIERLLEEADLQNISQMVRNWMSRNRRLVPNVFYQYGFFPLWVRISQTFINFLKLRLEVFNTLKIVFGIPETDPAMEPFIFMGLSFGDKDTLLCVLVPQSLRHSIKTSLQSSEVTAQLRRIHINGIYFSRVRKKSKKEQVSGSQMSISSACESMTSNDLYDSIYEDVQCSESLSSLQELNPNQQNLKHKPDWTTMNGIYNDHDFDRPGNRLEIDSKPQLVRISSDYVVDTSISLKTSTFKENEGVEEWSQKPQLVQISSAYVGQNPSNIISGVGVKPPYGKCFFVEYRINAQTCPKSIHSTAHVKANSFQVPAHYNDHANPRDVTKDSQFLQSSEITEISLDESLESSKSTKEYGVHRPKNKLSWEDEPHRENLSSDNKCQAFQKEHKTHGLSREYYHGNDQNIYLHGDNEVPGDNSVSFHDYSKKTGRHFQKENNRYGNEDRFCANSQELQYYLNSNLDYHGNQHDKYDNANRDNHDESFYRGKSSSCRNISSDHQNDDKRWNEATKNDLNTYDYYGNDKIDSGNQRIYDGNRHCRLHDYHFDSKPYYQRYLSDQRNGYHDDNDKQHQGNDPYGNGCDGYQDNKVYNQRNELMLPEPEPERTHRPVEHQPSLSSFTNGFEPICHSTPNSSVSGFSTHKLSFKFRNGNISSSMPTLYHRESEQRSTDGRKLLRQFSPKYESQADLEDHVFMNTHENTTKLLPSDYYCAPPNYQEAIIKKSFFSLSSLDVDMRCKKVKSPLLSTQSLSSIYREKEQLLSKEELQESIRSAEIKEWEKLLDKAKDFIKAAKLGDEEEVQYLLNEGVDADYMNEFGQTALMIACREGHLQVVNVLITYSADLNIQDRFGKSALHEAAWSGKHQVIAPLVSKDADINAIDEEGRTPLQFAAIRGQTKVAEVLLLLGADPSILNKHGEAAVELAYKRRHKDIINLLLNSTNKEVRKNTRSQIRKLKIRHLKSATSLSKKRNL